MPKPNRLTLSGCILVLSSHLGCGAPANGDRALEPDDSSEGGATAAAGGNPTSSTGGGGGPAEGGGQASSAGGTSQAGSSQGGGGGSAGGGNADGGPIVFPPGSPGCGLDAAAFCDTFDAPAGFKTRAGELDPAKWSAARMCNIGLPSIDDQAVSIGPAAVPKCRAGLPAQVFPSSDALICDGNDQIHSNHLLMLVAAQNYGQNSYRIRQPFDFADRTGTIAFDAEGHNVGNQGWISMEITEDPTPAPSFTLAQNFENGALPRNAIEVQFYEGCGGAKVGVRDVIVYDDFVQTTVLTGSSVCVAAPQGKLNHFRVRVSRNHIEISATPASEDGLVFGDPVVLGAADIKLPFTRGYVHMTTHNHATLKYSGNTVDAWLARWDNVGFDGPAITGGWREYEALDSLLATKSGKISMGWRLADATTGPAQTIEIPNVDRTGLVSARIALGNWVRREPGVDPPPASFALNYRLNGHAWKARKLTASELQMMATLPNGGTRSLMLDVDVADLVMGTNALQLTTTNALLQNPPPVALNVDLILKTN